MPTDWSLIRTIRVRVKLARRTKQQPWKESVEPSSKLVTNFQRNYPMSHCSKQPATINSKLVTKSCLGLKGRERTATTIKAKVSKLGLSKNKEAKSTYFNRPIETKITSTMLARKMLTEPRNSSATTSSAAKTTSSKAIFTTSFHTILSRSSRNSRLSSKRNILKSLRMKKRRS